MFITWIHLYALPAHEHADLCLEITDVRLKIKRSAVQFRRHFVTSFTSLNICANSSLIARLRLSMSPRRFLLVLKLFSVKNTERAFKASSISWKWHHWAHTAKSKGHISDSANPLPKGIKHEGPRGYYGRRPGLLISDIKGNSFCWTNTNFIPTQSVPETKLPPICLPVQFSFQPQPGLNQERRAVVDTLSH